MSLPNNQYISGYRARKWSGNEESSFCKVKWKKQLDTMYHEIHIVESLAVLSIVMHSAQKTE